MMNRQLTAKITESDTASILAAELVQHGLIAEVRYINVPFSGKTSYLLDFLLLLTLNL